MRQMLHVLLISILFLLVLPVIAQTDLDESYEWEDEGITVDYPDDWDSFVDDNDFVHLVSDETDMFFVFENYDPDDDLIDYIESSFDEYTFDRSARFDGDDVLIGELEDFDLTASYFYTDELDGEEFERVIFAIPLNDDVIAIANIVPITDDEIEEIDIVIDVLATLTISGAGASSDDNYVFDNGLELEMPSDWGEEAEIFSNGDIDVSFFFFEVADERFDTRTAALREIFNSTRLYDTPYDEDQILFIDLENDEEAIAYVLEEDFYTIIIAYTPNDDLVVVAVSSPSDVGDTEAVFDFSEDFYVFIETMD